MINYIIRLILVGIVVYLIPNYLVGIAVRDIQTAILVAFVMSILNTFIKPVLQLLSLPITILTLGLFYFVINVVIVYICHSLVPGFSVSGFLAPLIFSIVLSLVNGIIGSFQK